jgi:hypothetical protein
MMGGRRKSKGAQKRTRGAMVVKPAAAPAPEGTVMERFGTIDQLDRSFDIEYWQRQGDAAIFRAAWELVEAYWRDRGRDPDELRLQRSVEAIQRF